MKNNIRPLLIIGTQRSGSNLLRLMLNQLPEIDAPHPPHLLQVFTPLLPAYGSLDIESNFRKLVTDVCRYVEVNPVPWTGINLNPEEVFLQCNVRTLVEIFKVVYELKAKAKGAAYWSCKSMVNFYFMPEIESGGIHPVYIYIYRDGRDVAASFENTIVGEKHIYFIAKLWKQDQETALRMIDKFAKERTIMLRYEEFIRNPRVALLPVLKILGLEWTDEILNFYKSEEAIRTASSGEMWRNVTKPVDSSNMRHYTERLSQEEILIFEKVAGATLRKLGYETDNASAYLKEDFTKEEIEGFQFQNDELKKVANFKYAKDALVRVPQQKILAEIKNRMNGQSVKLLKEV